jgi:L-aspartate oxidase
MTEGAGVVRSADSLAGAKAVIDAIGRAHGSRVTLGSGAVDRAAGELANLVTAATSLLVSATRRTETRGAHARSDHPDPEERWRRRIVHVGAAAMPGRTTPAGDRP